MIVRQIQFLKFLLCFRKIINHQIKCIIICINCCNFKNRDISFFQPQNIMVKCDTNHGKYMASPSVLQRGNNTKRSQCCTCINKIYQINWCTKGFKLDINYNLLPAYMISNKTAIEEVFARIDYKFDLMYSKKVLIYWFIQEGMEEGEFIEARENISALGRIIFFRVKQLKETESTLKD
ncbi:unnamed protein product (macronuclear) [Paramecium tetraurelia]|uniref:Tubulin/FtsZ 2-layer sandwich domain-containing protein n=1 Tax=Paramecium tetraurelia TaxID=5888 RepID=A0BQ87_PARTE|nr:uncharacterized protein GSPATT00030933001 [Paramecium tetraurelia]CAK60704.1 unnamed protein product [Paramecium tetraurelia]|eukprot:XP_001428102.1 hypothetical protein (macronuclear) [Paramecium tetraurelia strain d4-2]